MKQGVGFAHGKIILMGEHSVVYGEPAIAIPFPSVQVKTTVELAIDEPMIHCSFYNGLLESMPELLESLKKVIGLSLEKLNQQNKLTFKIESSIPAERGMGSSAAVAVATTRAIFDFYQTNLNETELLEIVAESEKIAHGNPSGLDALMTSSQNPYYYQKAHIPAPFSINLNAVLVVGDSGQTGKTKEAVADVAKKMARPSPNHSQEIVKQLGKLADTSLMDLKNNQAQQLGENMTRAHQLLQQLDVSNSILDSLVNAALEANALGAKLTGGGRGGCIIALASNLQDAYLIIEKLKKAGATNTWLYEMSDDNDE